MMHYVVVIWVVGMVAVAINISIIRAVVLSARRTLRTSYEHALASGLQATDALAVAVISTPHVLMLWRRWCVNDLRAGGYGQGGSAMELVGSYLARAVLDQTGPWLGGFRYCIDYLLDRFNNEVAGPVQTRRLLKGPRIRVPARVFTLYVRGRRAGSGLLDALGFAISTLDMVPKEVRWQALVDVYHIRWSENEDAAVPAVVDHVLDLAIKKRSPCRIELSEDGVVTRTMSEPEYLEWQFAQFKAGVD
jgi:hypothetical protein